VSAAQWLDLYQFAPVVQILCNDVLDVWSRLRPEAWVLAIF